MSNILSTKLVLPHPLSPTKTKTFFCEEVDSWIAGPAFSAVESTPFNLALAISQRLLGAKLPSLALEDYAWLLGAAGFFSYCSLFRL